MSSLFVNKESNKDSETSLFSIIKFSNFSNSLSLTSEFVLNFLYKFDIKSFEKTRLYLLNKLRVLIFILSGSSS